MEESLATMWSGTNSTYKFSPKQIILGVSFAKVEEVNKTITPQVLKLAQGGISVWAKKGGVYQ